MQLSVGVIPANTSGTGAWQLTSAVALGTGGQLTVGTVESCTVIVWAKFPLLLPHPSLKFQVLTRV